VCTVTGVGDEVVARTVAEPSADWWRPTRTLATWLTWLLAAQAVGQLLGPLLWDNAARYVKWHRALDALLDGRDHTANRIFRDASKGTNPAWGTTMNAINIAALVLLIIWTWRSAHNAQALGRTGARLAPGWAIAGWFIPLANFVLLYLIFSDLWRSSDPTSGRGTSWRSLSGATLVRLWWAVYLGGLIVFGGATALAVGGVNGESSTRALLVTGGIILSVATLLSILVVRRITERQEALQAADPAPTSRPVARQFVTPGTGDGPGWYADPSRRYDHRYWDGNPWTEHVSTAGVPTTAPVTPPDWYPDPTGRFHWRYWTGHAWTEHVSRDQELFVDPLEGDTP